MSWFRLIVVTVRGALVDRTELATENLALRQQLAILTAKKRRPGLMTRDCIFWVWLSRLWPGWRSALVIVQPDTVARWHQ